MLFTEALLSPSIFVPADERGGHSNWNSRSKIRVHSCSLVRFLQTLYFRRAHITLCRYGKCNYFGMYAAKSDIIHARWENLLTKPVLAKTKYISLPMGEAVWSLVLWRGCTILVHLSSCWRLRSVLSFVCWRSKSGIIHAGHVLLTESEYVSWPLREQGCTHFGIH